VALQCCRAEKSVVSLMSGSSVASQHARPKRKIVMASPTTLSTPYLQRLELVSDTIKTHSKLADKAASELAVHVLHALNSIPEKMR
jgi:hypothetical protein